MSKELCVEGLKLRFSINGTDVTNTGVSSILSTPSKHTKIDDKGVYAGIFNVTFSGSSYNGYTQVEPANFAISCGSQYSKDDNKAIMLIEDMQTVESVSFQMGQYSALYNIKCEVTDAGQNAVREI